MQSIGLRAAARIVVAYVIAASTWIVFSDIALARLGLEPAIARTLESAKGLLFVAITGALLFGLVYREFGRHQATQRRLADTRRLSQAVADALPAVVYTRQPNTGEVMYLNRGMARLLGHTQPRPWADLVHPEDAPAWAAAGAPLAAGEVRTHDFRCQHTSGEWRWLRSREVLLDADASGQPGALLGVTVDITAAKQAEANLAASELRWRLLVETIPDYVAVHDAAGHFQFLNHYAEGYSAENVVGRHYAEFLPEASRAVYDQALDRIRRTGQPAFVEYTAPGDQGAMRHYDSYIVPINEAGALTGFLVVARDITAAKEQEAALLAAHELAQMTFHVGPLPAVLRRLADRSIVDVNRAFETLTGYTRADVIGRPIDTDDLWADPGELQRVKEILLHTGAVTDYEFTLKTRAGALHRGVMFAKIFVAGGERFVLTKFMDITRRWEAEAALRRSEETLRLFVEFAPAAIAMFDRNMNYLAASRRYRTDYDLGEQDLIGRSHYAVLPEIPDRWREIHQRCLAGAVERAEEDPFQRADGRLDWVRREIRPWHEADGSIGGLILFSEVITEQKRAAEALQESEEKFRHVFEAANVGKSITHPSGKLAANKAFADLLGYTQAELAQMTWQALTPPEDIAAIEAILAPLRAGVQNSTRFTKRYVHRNGTLVWADVSTTVRRGADGQPLHFITTLVDVTARKRAEEELRASREMFSSAFHMGPVGMTITRIADGTFIDVNQAFLAMFEFSREEVIGHTSLELNMLTPASRRSLIQQQLESGGLRAAELQARSRSGKLVDILFSSRPLVLSGEECHVTTMIDITNRKQAEDALRQLNAKLEQRVAERTAELKAQYEQQAALEERQRLARELHDVVSQTLFSASVIAETLPRLWERDAGLARQALGDLHRLTRGALAEMRTLLLELRPEAMRQSALPDLLGHLVNALRGRTELDILLTAEPTAPLPPEVRVALYRIAQEALNNVVNHARARRVEITLGAPAAGRGVEMRLRDDGQGFDPTHLDPGRMGLAILRERAEAIGATLALRSQPGQGAEVAVTWLAPGESEAAARSPAE